MRCLFTSAGSILLLWIWCVCVCLTAPPPPTTEQLARTIPPETVLEGTWTVDPSGPLQQSGINQLLRTGDQNGVIEAAQYQRYEDPEVTVPLTEASTTVDGPNVWFEVALLGSNFLFAGTLNEMQDVMTGSSSARVIHGLTVITVDNAPTTLTRW